jgi:hypothetical protein
MNFKFDKKWLLLGGIGFVVLFFLISFIAAYYEYKTKGPLSEEPYSSYDEDAFNRLHEELIKDKPKNEQQKELIKEIVDESNKQAQFINKRKDQDDLYSKGAFDTLAVNCSVLLERYKELAIAYHELKKQVPEKKKVRTAKRTRTTPRRSSASTARSTTAGGFDYTKYIRGSTNSELHNTGAGSLVNTKYTWATLSLRQRQKVFNQSIVEFVVAEAFSLDGISIPHLARVEGVAQVARGRGRIFVNFNKIYTHDQTINVEGEAFSLDRSRGINVFIHGENSLAEGLKREASDLVSLIDPSRSQIGRSVIQDTDVGQEVFGTLDTGTMVLANLRRR